MSLHLLALCRFILLQSGLNKAAPANPSIGQIDKLS